MNSRRQSRLPETEGTSASNISIAGWQRARLSGPGLFGQRIPDRSTAAAAAPTSRHGRSVLGGRWHERRALPPRHDPAGTPLASASARRSSFPPISSTSRHGQSKWPEQQLLGQYRHHRGERVQQYSHQLDRLASDKSGGRDRQLRRSDADIATVNSGDTQIHAQYDALTNQILLSNVIQGAGGYVYINGKIISTSSSGSPQGNIVVNGGAGTALNTP